MRILHLEDNAHDATLIGEALTGTNVPCDITRVDTKKAFSEALDSGSWDIVLADYALPSFDGVSALKLATAIRPGTPFVFVTGTLGEERAVEALKNGATDHVLKHRLDRLPQVVARAIQECESLRARQDAEQATKVLLRETELLLQEVHHRVNNNFQIICSLMTLQVETGDPQQAPALQRSLKRIDAMARAHAMLYTATSLQDIDFAEYVRVMAGEAQQGHAVRTGSAVRLVLDLMPTRLEIDRAIPCGLILNELVSNALMHGFPGGRIGEVRVSLSRDEGNVTVTVEDDGIGPVEGYQLESARTAGFNIVNVLTKQLRGTLESDSSCGSRFTLTFA